MKALDEVLLHKHLKDLTVELLSLVDQLESYSMGNARG